jgi:hypothetical protein
MGNSLLDMTHCCCKSVPFSSRYAEAQESGPWHTVQAGRICVCQHTYIQHAVLIYTAGSHACHHVDVDSHSSCSYTILMNEHWYYRDMFSLLSLSIDKYMAVHAANDAQ